MADKKKPLRSIFQRRLDMGADDPGGPIDLEHMESGGTVLGKPGAYRDAMRYMTEDAIPAGPDARRAEALEPAGPRGASDDVALQKDPAAAMGRLAPLLKLFGGRR